MAIREVYRNDEHSFYGIIAGQAESDNVFFFFVVNFAIDVIVTIVAISIAFTSISDG